MQVDWAIGFDRATAFYQEMHAEESPGIRRSHDGRAAAASPVATPYPQVEMLLHQLNRVAAQLEHRGQWTQAVALYSRMLALLPLSRTARKPLDTSPGVKTWRRDQYEGMTSPTGT